MNEPNEPKIRFHSKQTESLKTMKRIVLIGSRESTKIIKPKTQVMIWQSLLL